MGIACFSVSLNLLIRWPGILTILAHHELRNKLRREALLLATEWFSQDMGNTRVLEAYGVAGGAGMLKTECVSSGGPGEFHP